MADVKSILHDLQHPKPFLVCLCDAPVVIYRDYILWRDKCQCGGWVDDYLREERRDG